MSIRKKITKVLFIVFFIVLFYNIGQQLLNSLQADKRLNAEIENLTKLQKKNSELKKKLIEVQSSQFIEKQARDKLNFARPDETVIIIPQKDIERVLGQDKKVEGVSFPNWRGWLKLFLY